MKGHINFNSVLLLLIGALLAFGVKKLDENNTQIIKVGVQQESLMSRVDSLDKKVADTVLKADYQSEILRLYQRIDNLEKKLGKP